MENSIKRKVKFVLKKDNSELERVECQGCQTLLFRIKKTQLHKALHLEIKCRKCKHLNFL